MHGTKCRNYIGLMQFFVVSTIQMYLSGISSTVLPVHMSLPVEPLVAYCRAGRSEVVKILHLGNASVKAFHTRYTLLIQCKHAYYAVWYARGE